MALDKFGRHVSSSSANPYFESYFYDDDDDDYEYFDFNNKRRIINLVPPLYDEDAVVNKHFLKTELDKLSLKLQIHKQSTNNNIDAANEIIKSITADIEHLYKVLKLARPSVSPAVATSSQPSVAIDLNKLNEAQTGSATSGKPAQAANRKRNTQARKGKL